MTEDLAYILGLFVGGGSIGNNSFELILPFKKWGLMPNVITQLSLDIAIETRKKFLNCFNINIDFQNTQDSWRIVPLAPYDLNPLLTELSNLNLPTNGNLIDTVDISILKAKLNSYYAEYFLSGLCDTRGSVVPSHRRFNSGAPIVSIEIPGSTNNFIFVTQLCGWLHEMNVYADQILYNHPCQHAPSNPLYHNWKKGFKIRFLAKEFIESKSFSLKAKADQADRLARRQNVEDQGPCEKRKLNGKVKPICIHCDINSRDLPSSVRGRIFLHYSHLCAVVGCPYAPVKELQKIVKDYKNHISVLPLLIKYGDCAVARRMGGFQGNNNKETQRALAQFKRLQQLYFPASISSRQSFTVKFLTESEMFSKYSKLGEAIAFLFSPTLNGQRHEGPQSVIINNNLSELVSVEKTNNIGEPMVLINDKNDRAAIVSTIDSDFNRKLIDKLLTVNNLDIKVDSSFKL